MPEDIYTEAVDIIEALDATLTLPEPDWSAVREKALRLAEIAEQHERKEDR